MLNLSLVLRRKDENVISWWRPLWVVMMFGCHCNFEAVHRAPSYSSQDTYCLHSLRCTWWWHLSGWLAAWLWYNSQHKVYYIGSVQSCGVALTFNACDLTLCSHKETRIFFFIFFMQDLAFPERTAFFVGSCKHFLRPQPHVTVSSCQSAVWNLRRKRVNSWSGAIVL